jgi:hypothetical protein
MNWQAPATGRRGRQPTFSDAAIQFCLTIKCLFSLALRQATGMVESMLRLAGLDWAVPDFSTLSRRQKDLLVRIPVQRKQRVARISQRRIRGWGGAKTTGSLWCWV